MAKNKEDRPATATEAAESLRIIAAT